MSGSGIDFNPPAPPEGDPIFAVSPAASITSAQVDGLANTPTPPSVSNYYLTLADLTSGGGIYSGSGSLSVNTIVTQAANSIAFNGVSGDNATTFSIDPLTQAQILLRSQETLAGTDYKLSIDNSSGALWSASETGSTEQTNMTWNFQQLNFTSEDTAASGSNLLLSPGNIDLKSEDSTTSDIFGLGIIAGTSSSIFAEDGATGDRSALTIDLAAMTIDDVINLKGVVYGADYSSNFTARSLVDKAYVDGLADADGIYTGSGSLIADTTITLAGFDLILASTTSGFRLPVMTTTERDLIDGGSPIEALQIYNTTTDRPEYEHITQGWIPIGRRAGNGVGTGQVQYAGSDGNFGPGALQVSSQVVFPMIIGTGVVTNFGTAFGNAATAFGGSFFLNLNVRGGESNGYKFFSESDAGIWGNASGAGDGLTFYPTANKNIFKLCARDDRGVVLSNLDFSDTTETADHVTAFFGGNGITTYAGQTATVIEALTNFGSLPSGSSLYVDDVTGGPSTFTLGAGKYFNDGVWKKTAMTDQSYSISNLTPDRIFDPTSTTLNEVAQVLATFITDTGFA